MLIKLVDFVTCLFYILRGCISCLYFSRWILIFERLYVTCMHHVLMFPIFFWIFFWIFELDGQFGECHGGNLKLKVLICERIWFWTDVKKIPVVVKVQIFSYFDYCSLKMWARLFSVVIFIRVNQGFDFDTYLYTWTTEVKFLASIFDIGQGMALNFFQS